ncbi:uncharacterized protein BT62DRAFT_924873 [Guyanagaster necrorhizus]|uniref:Carbohydrate-binding module family 19 domain-containing protein n=1 Tax=Guyanagaster necrorhizus TaxID=856835 RepID=A0A9P7VEE2_9AGAR|nr:uncharacterized protein BT62DRAFT_924873 [Guyanagaster necrorhizus MCA 3950]KAG7439179.1 hypothetical protein BT62DRAFT_924873 [Guyanagaster necrorhizus MCA 3950]
MVHFNPLLVLSASIALSSALPLQKRIAQIIADSTADWEQACLTAGGSTQCNPLSQTAFTSLLAAGANCDQQNAADQMIDLAKQLSSNAEMIRLTQLFVQQPRNAPDSLQVPYCQTAPKNSELNGLFHCQFAGSDFTKFSGDQTGNVPLGLTAVNPAGSCPAKPDGPVPDGVQLNTLVTNPGVGSSNSTGSAAVTGSSQPTGSSTATGSVSAAAAASTVSAAVAANNGAAGSTSIASAASASASTTGFQLQNGEDAKALNAQFATLTPSSPCTTGDEACVDDGFAQCVGSQFTITQCAGGTQCFALPLVNKAGTSIACTTQADANSRIAATGA